MTFPPAGPVIEVGGMSIPQYRDNGKENGNYNIVQWGIYWGIYYMALTRGLTALVRPKLSYRSLVGVHIHDMSGAEPDIFTQAQRLQSNFSHTKQNRGSLQ